MSLIPTSPALAPADLQRDVIGRWRSVKTVHRRSYRPNAKQDRFRDKPAFEHLARVF
jgi:hypothetical protein